MVLARWTVLAYITCSTASTLSHQYASFDIVDTKVLVALNMDESNGFNQDWSPKVCLVFVVSALLNAQISKGNARVQQECL